MKSFEELFDGNFLEEIELITSSENANFGKLVILSGLDPAKDFQNANLSGVIFDHSDLRGFDFTGADLSGSTGVNVKFDETTRIDGANLRDSLFALQGDINELLRSNPHLADEIRRLRGKDWYEMAVWANKTLDFKGQVDPEKQLLAVAAFSNVSDPGSRAQMLPFMKKAFSSKEKHSNFLVSVIAKGSLDDPSVRQSIKSLSAYHREEGPAFDILCRIALDPGVDPVVHEWAMRGITKSSKFPRFIPFLSDANSLLSKKERRWVTGAFASLYGPPFIDLFEERKEGAAPIYFDYNKKIDLNTVLLFANRLKRSYNYSVDLDEVVLKDLRKKISKGSVSKRNLKKVNKSQSKINFNQSEYLILRVINYLVFIRKRGLLLEFSQTDFRRYFG